MARPAKTKAAGKTETVANASAAKAAPAAPVLPSAPHPSIEDMRRALMRKLAIFVSDWRRCPRRLCRRKRACQPDGVYCLSPTESARSVSPEQEARAMGWLKRELERRLAAAQPK
jgi:hypothetical protein